jgi:hypothetical protein
MDTDNHDKFPLLPKTPDELRVRFGLEVGAAGDDHEMVSLWVNDTRFDGVLMSRTLPFYETRLKLVKEKLIKKLVKHLIYHDLDLTPTPKKGNM